MKLMRKEEVLWLYELGERNFRRKSLRGKSFRGDDLSGADFSGSDLRGTDFTNAILRGANFTNAVTGLEERQSLALFGTLAILAAIAGLIGGFIGTVVELKFYTTGLDASLVKWVTLGIALGFSFVSLAQGMAIGFIFFAIAFILAGTPALVSSDAVPIAGAMAVIITVNAVVALATAVAGIMVVTGMLAFRLIVAATIGLIFVFTFAFAMTLANRVVTAHTPAYAIAISAVVMAVSAYTGWRALKGDRKHILIWQMCNTIASKWGTSFRGADLTDADFNRAVLKSADFTDANLTRTNWSKDAGMGIPIARRSKLSLRDSEGSA